MIDVIILAGGLGARSRSYLTVPKAAALVRGVPMIVHQLRWLAESKVVGRAVLALGHGADEIKMALEGYPEILTTSSFAETHGTASAVRRAMQWVSIADPFGVLNGDTLLDLDLLAMIQAHNASGSIITSARVGEVDAGLYLLSSIARTYLAFTGTSNFPDYVKMLGSASFPARSFIDIGTEDGWRRANDELQGQVQPIR